MKTLYFEGAGCVPRGDLENCRIRTAFTLDNGKKVYLEIMGVEVTKQTAAVYAGFTNVSYIDFCHYDTGDRDDCQKNRVYRGDGTTVERNARSNFEYTRENLLKFVNSLGASFEAVEILPDLAGYRVHADNGGYNLADEFHYDRDRTAQAEKIKQYFYDFEKNVLGKKYPNFSIWFETDILKVLIHYNRYNDIIEIEDVFKFNFDYKQPEGTTVVK